MKKKVTCTFLYLLIYTAAIANNGIRNPEAEKELNTFIRSYVDATNSHNFANVQSLLMTDAIYWFNKNESRGIAEIKANFESTWSYLPDEIYGIEKVKWLSIEENSATCIYEYTYQGTHDGKPLKGRGRGTTVLVKQDGKWLIAHEHLSIPQ